MTIEPTTTAAESSSTPAVAMTALTTVNRTYVGSSGAICSAWVFSSSREMRPLVSSSAAYSSLSRSNFWETTVSASRTTV